MHLFWHWATRAPVPGLVRVVPGVDVRGDGGYVVAPPSVHASGRRYTWHAGRGPHQISPVAAPGWLVETVLTRTDPKRYRTSARRDWWLDLKKPIAPGHRNYELFRIACGVRASGHNEAEIATVIRGVNARLCLDPLGDKEISNIARSAARY